jgi:type I restriction enzyme S subunit
LSDNKNLKPGWKTWRFDQMATNVNVRIDNPSESGMEHYVGLEHLDSDSLKIRRWGTPDDVEATKLMFKKGDIIFGRRRAYQRKLGVAEFDGICSAHAMVLRAKPEVVLPEFLPFFMQSDFFMNRAVEISVGSLSPTINWKTMAAQEFALPSIDTQAEMLRILRECEETRLAIDEGAASALQLRKSLLAGIVKQAESNKSYKPLADVCSHIVDCLHRTPKYQPQGFPAIRTTDIEDGILNLSQCYKVPEDELRLQTSRLAPIGGDIVFSREAPMGHAALVPHKVRVCISQRVMHLRVRAEVSSAYVMELINSPYVRSQVEKFATGSTVKHINVADVKKLRIPMVSYEAQEEFASLLSELREAGFALHARRANVAAIKVQLLTSGLDGGGHVQ